MVTWTKRERMEPGYVVREGVCLSTDTKPTAGIGNGSTLMEMDTGSVYVFDEAGSTWLEL